MLGVVPWNIPLRFGRGQKYPPIGICGGGHSPWNYKYILKIASLSILDVFERSIHTWIANDVYNFYKNSGHLEFQRKPAAILDFVCFWTFINKIIFPLREHHCTIYVIYSDAAYSAEDTVY